MTERRALERETLDISAREQRRIAGDLDDALQQHLIGTAMQAKALARSLAARNDDHAAAAEGLYALVLKAVTGLRTVVQGIVPVQASENGLMLALDGLSAKVRDLYGVPCTFVYETPVHVGNFELATQLYYIAQEAAVNAAKHAGASAVEIGLVLKGEHASLSVHDDGKGFTYRADETPSSGGMGLRLMAYRAWLVGAQLEVESQPGGGTIVTCTFEPR